MVVTVFPDNAMKYLALVHGAIMIAISITPFNEIRDHAIREYPHECCGAILKELSKAKKSVQANVIYWTTIGKAYQRR